MVASKASGELILIRLVHTVFPETNSRPNRISDILIVSAARSAAVTEPMKGLSENFI